MWWYWWSFGTRKCQHVACMEHRKCSGMGGVLVQENVSKWHVWSTGNVVVLVDFRQQEMSSCGMYGAHERWWYVWSFRNRKCQHVACTEHRKCSGMGGVLVQGNVSMWHLWSTGNVAVLVDFWQQEMSSCGMYGAQEM